MGGDWFLPNEKYNYGYRTASGWFDDWSDLSPALQGIFAGFIVILSLAAVALFVLLIIGMVKTFKKAKQPGWAAIVPFYNLYTVIKITGLEFWWFVLFALIPMHWASWLGTLFIWGLLNYKIAQSFGKTLGFAIGLTLLPPIFWLILGCSPSIKYKGPAGPYKIKSPEKA